MPGKLIEFESAGALRSGYLALPATPATAGVLVIQEWWGLVPHIKNVADRFAAAGYAALAPDSNRKLFSRCTCFASLSYAPERGGEFELEFSTRNPNFRKIRIIAIDFHAPN